MLTLPLYPILFILIKLSSPGPFIFKQKRIGKNKIPFMMYKFRTMVKDADKLRAKYAKMNELGGPLYKITNDPRHTWIGRIMIRTTIDELPQLINIVKGEMAFVGPRPFPIYEAEKISKKYDKRYSVLPGLTGPWVIKGFHDLPFDEWMRLDVEYAKEKNTLYDINIVLQTAVMLLKLIVTKLI